MKINIQKLIACVLAAVTAALIFSGCSSKDTNTRLDTQLTVSQSFAGQRVITCKFPESIASSSAAESQLDDIISKYCPNGMTAQKSNGTGLAYTFTINFDSKSDYCTKLKNITGLDLDVSFGVYDSIITKGWSLYEDFSTEAPVAWLYNAIEENEAKDLYYTYDTSSKPVVTVDGTTGESIGTNSIYSSSIKGSAIHSVEIETTNYKNKTYDRKIKLLFPEATYNALGNELQNYISEAAGHTTSEFWTKSGNYHVFEALYQGIDYTEMGNVTSSLLFCSDESIKYGDLTNSSTPLAEQLVFEEKLNLLGFVPEKDKSVGLTYSYTIPSDTSGGDGIILKSGKWEKSGDWHDGKYTLSGNSPALTLRVPDGKQYSVDKIDITLSKTEGSKFKRTMDFVYPSGSDEGYGYTCNYFNNIGVKVIKDKDSEENLICRLSLEGEASQISEQLGKIFGGGNFVNVSVDSRLSSVVTSIDLSDSINIDYMLPKGKSSTPITYTVIRETGENITELSASTGESKEKLDLSGQKGNTLTMTLPAGNTTVTYNATVPYTKGIIFCVSIFAVILVLAVAVSTYMIQRGKLQEKDMKKRHSGMMRTSKKDKQDRDI